MRWKARILLQVKALLQIEDLAADDVPGSKILPITDPLVGSDYARGLPSPLHFTDSRH